MSHPIKPTAQTRREARREALAKTEASVRRLQGQCAHLSNSLNPKLKKWVCDSCGYIHPKP